MGASLLVLYFWALPHHILSNRNHAESVFASNKNTIIYQSDPSEQLGTHSGGVCVCVCVCVGGWVWVWVCVDGSVEGCVCVWMFVGLYLCECMLVCLCAVCLYVDEPKIEFQAYIHLCPFGHVFLARTNNSNI